jgi:hypothetical protein
MKPAEYLEAVQERLVTDPVISRFHILRQRYTSFDAHIRGVLELSDGSRLEFSEYVQIGADETPSVITYSYHWCAGDGSLIRRWDNTPHHPNAPGFPHHVHSGIADEIRPGVPMSIHRVLDELARNLSPNGLA